ncbi:MAG TPA: hypothetical protein DDW27_13895, partial [Bacteroidales bacterium]|nr:hypothetical protein [Bacteroidales bacterium]
MRTLKTGLLLIALVAVFTSCDKSANQKFMMNAKFNALINPIPLNAGDCGEQFTTKLMAGQHIEAGQVNVWVQDGTLMVKYIANSDWLISETHLAVENDADLIPHTNTGNPKIGNFKYNRDHDPMVSEVLYEVPLANLGPTVYIAAHAVVWQLHCDGIRELEAMLPGDDVLVGVSFSNPAYLAADVNLVDSYYDLTISGAGALDGIYPSWCADNNGRPVDYSNAYLISSYSASCDLGSVVPKPENLDNLNYLMNKYYPGTGFKVLQAAIWTLMNGSYNFISGGITKPPFTTAEKDEVDHIIADALDNGEGFVPGPSDYLVILVHSGDRK